jgi:hypothetical protein
VTSPVDNDMEPITYDYKFIIMQFTELHFDVLLGVPKARKLNIFDARICF